MTICAKIVKEKRTEIDEKEFKEYLKQKDVTTYNDRGYITGIYKDITRVTINGMLIAIKA